MVPAPLASDPADLFAQLYDQLEEDSLRDPDQVSQWLEPAHLEALATDIRSKALAGRLNPAEIAKSIGAAADRRGLLVAVLVGLERALGLVHPRTSALAPKALIPIASRYAETGLLNSSAVRGALLPRFCRPRGTVTPTNKRELFHGLLRISPDDWKKVAYAVLPERYDVSLTGPGALTVGCAPAMESLEEIEIERPRRVLGSHFRLRPKDSDEVRERFRRILDRLDASGAHLGVLPESVLSEQLLGYWQELVLRVVPPMSSKLQWLLVGTGPVDDRLPPRNTAVLLHRRTGKILLQQDKMKPFTLSGAQLREWGLEALLGVRDVQEDIQCGSRLTLMETRIGRVAVLICEDLSRVLEFGNILQSHGVSLILTPIFAKQIEPFHWEHVKARDYVQEIGTRTIVVNSLMVPRQTAVGSSVRVALVVVPEGYWIGKAAAGDDVIWYTIELADEESNDVDEATPA